MKFAEKLRAKNENPIGAAPVTIAFLGDSVTQGCFECCKTGESSLETEFRVNDGYHMKLRGRCVQSLMYLFAAAQKNG